MNSILRFAKETAVGLTASITPVARRLEETKTQQEEQRHPLHESIQLLNAMRASGGIRKVHKGFGDNGIVVDHTPDKILRHADFHGLHESISSDTERPDAGWVGYGKVLESGEKPKFTVDEVRQAVQNMNGGRSSIPSLQEELFGK